jgi:hypothetical protein
VLKLSELDMLIEGLQNLYASVRFRPAPPDLSIACGRYPPSQEALGSGICSDSASNSAICCLQHCAKTDANHLNIHSAQ